MIDTEQVWLVRYSEVFLKSEPVRREWEKTLIRNIKRVLPGAEPRRERGRIWLAGEVDPEVLRNVFGIVSFSLCDVVPLDDLPKGLLAFCERHGIAEAATFALRIRRIGTISTTRDGRSSSRSGTGPATSSTGRSRPSAAFPSASRERSSRSSPAASTHRLRPS